MKKFLGIVTSIILIYAIYDIVFYRIGFFIDFHPEKEAITNIYTSDKKIYLKKEDNNIPFEIKGVDLGSGIPGHFATDYAIDKKTYLRWFKYIKEMGANTIRVYTILNDDFYNAVYEFNNNNEDPLYVIHGLWVNDYTQNSRIDAYQEQFLGTMLDDSRTLVDVIHGHKSLSLKSGLGGGSYRKDISPWVIGYILGVEWESATVSYTDHLQSSKNRYKGNYMYTTEDATPFEALLAQVGDKIIEYESKKYKTQRLVAFSNWPTTDPFQYNSNIKNLFKKTASIDVEHIKTTDKFHSGVFASYHIYPYYPDFLSYNEQGERITTISNTYKEYLKKINEHHTIPVVISEFGVPSSRGMAYKDQNTNRNQGNLNEEEQGLAIINSYKDIKESGIDNCIIFTWQDEWFKRTWNTMHATDLTKTPYWSDYQTNEQYFGLLSFDPGKEKSVSYVDGDVTEWQENNLVTEQNGMSLSMKYDEKFLYFMVKKENYKGEKFYIPIDLTPSSGSKKVDQTNLTFNKDVDFLIVIDGKDNSRVLVQEYYDQAKATLGYELELKNAYVNPPLPDSSKFNTIQMMIDTIAPVNKVGSKNVSFETGKLRYGNANPDSKDFDSLADFIINGDYIEIKIPWGLLNFSDPSNMTIHDDYYKCYGVENKMINKMYVGVGDNNINLEEFHLKAWRKNVTFHERLKKSYYMVQELWREK